MPRRITWRETALHVNQADANVVLDGLESFDITKRNTLVCTNCADSEHEMRYRLLECSSESCAEASPVKRPWRGKVVTCLESTYVCIYEFGEHVSSAPSTKKKKLSTTPKEFCRALADRHLRPMRIRLALSRKFEASLEDLPSLTTVQNFVNYYSRTYLENHDRLNDLKAWIHAYAFSGREEMSQPFAFGWRYDNEGNQDVGNGSDKRHFIIGLTTKALMLCLMQPPECFILHVDATYKTNHVDYPVVVVGVSDCSRGFHLVALFVVSQETQGVFEEVLLSLRRLYVWITQKELVVQYTMGDGDKAQCNALHSGFGWNPSFKFLMCFFHVMEKVQAAIKPFSSHLAASLLRDIYDFRFARSHNDFLRMQETVLKNWLKDPRLHLFTRDMTGQWHVGRFSTWQAYATPSGFATTNNPAETFNAVLKRDYTLRRRLKMGALLREFSACCQDQSSSTKPFQFVANPEASLTRRVTELTRAELLCIGGGDQLDFVSAGDPNIVRVKAFPAPRVAVAPNKRSEEVIAASAQMGSNYGRMEVVNQPWGEWQVDLARQWCPCNYGFVFGMCVHVLYALGVSPYV